MRNTFARFLLAIAMLATTQGCASAQVKKPTPVKLAAVLGPYSSASNITADILGEEDTRPGTWGKTGYTVNTLEFKPPAGYRVRILRVYGNINVTPKVVDPAVTTLPAGSRASYLHGFQTTAPEGSPTMVPAADNTLTYYQGDVSDRVDVSHIEFNVDVSTGGLLQPDNKLWSKFGTFLNTLGMLHLEVSFTATYRFELQKP